MPGTRRNGKSRIRRKLPGILCMAGPVIWLPGLKGDINRDDAFCKEFGANHSILSLVVVVGWGCLLRDGENAFDARAVALASSGQ